MERKEREDRRRAEAETDRQTEQSRAEQQHMERQQNGKELTNEWNQTKGGEVLD